jgi:P-type Mg2+ transporter
MKTSELFKFQMTSKKAAIANDENVRRLIDACSCGEAESLRIMDSNEKGLSSEDIEYRLREYGANILQKKAKHNLFTDLFHRFKNPLVIQLLVICILSFVMGDLRSAGVVGAMIFMSVFLAYFQERASSQAAEKLQNLVQATTVVLRDGAEQAVPIHEVVPGDVVALTAGSIIPADVRILFAKDFFVSQSALTGESMPIEKFSGGPAAGQSPGGIIEPLELPNACFQGSNVISGSARALVVNTGLRTFLGSISTTLSQAKESTSFDKGVKSFVWLMIRFMLVMVSAVFMIVGITKHDWIQALLFSLSVAVGLTPEMLPMIMTVCLSKGAIAMSRKKVIVKKLKAIQNFGAMNILCTDKTGTLTQDRIILEKYVDVTSRQSGDVLRYAYMNSFYQTGLRNLLDKAVLAHEDLDVERTCKKVDEIPFDFVRKRMSVIIDYEDTHVLICKGAVEDVYAVCDQYQIDEEVYPLIDMVRNDLMEEYQHLSSDGYRVLAIAYKEFPKTQEVFSSADEDRMILLGYLAFFDPPKDSSARALRALKYSGVDVKILTGDNELVTQKVCHDVGFQIQNLVSGRQLAGLTPERLRETVRDSNVFVRLSPSQKEEIIQSLREGGNVVGYLGDGINDAPAMKAADVGISVDTAVDIAKESADIILLERSLLVLEDGILEGRRIFSNIIKYIKMGASSNFGNMFSVVGGGAFLPFLPMAPIQVLANNLLYDVSQVGIPTDRVDDEFVKKPQKWDIDFIKKFMIFIGPMSSIFDYATFFLMLYFFKCILFSRPDTSAEMKIYYEKLFHTGWFVESLLTQTLIVHVIRTNRIPFFGSRASVTMTFFTVLVMTAAAVLPYTPLGSLLGLVPLPAVYWLWIAGFLAAYCVITHVMKTWFNRRFGVAT